jgi:hypothetical protein
MRVFLSYANADVSTAETTANVLASDDYSVFFDRQSIRSGDVFSTAIKNALEECDIFVFFVSKNSVMENSFALLELGIALQHSKTRSLRIVPVLLDSLNDVKLPPEIAHLSAVRYGAHPPTALLAYLSTTERRYRHKLYYALTLLVAAIPAAAISAFTHKIWYFEVFDNGHSGDFSAIASSITSTLLTSVLYVFFYSYILPVNTRRAIGSYAVFIGCVIGVSILAWMEGVLRIAILSAIASLIVQCILHFLIWLQPADA